jgi:hypothetical protein
MRGISGDSLARKMPPMNIPREKGSLSLVVMVVILMLFAALGSYTAGYLWLSSQSFQTVTTNGVVTFRGHVRTFPHRWLARIYSPAAAIEAAIKQETVIAGYDVPGDLPEHLD